MYRIKNFTKNDDVRILDTLGPFTVIEYLRDLSVSPLSAQQAYFASEMNVRRRQVICDLSKAKGRQCQRHNRRKGRRRSAGQGRTRQSHGRIRHKARIYRRRNTRP